MKSILKLRPIFFVWLGWALISPGDMLRRDALRDLCARTDVPLDYRDPQAGTISLGLLRRPADDQAHRPAVAA